MAKIGLDISKARSKLIEPTIAARADRIITMSCDIGGVPRIMAIGALRSKDQRLECAGEIIDFICNKAAELAEETSPDR